MFGLALRRRGQLRHHHLGGIRAGLELHGGRLVVGFGLLLAQRLQVFDDGEVQPSQRFERGQRLVGGFLGSRRRTAIG